jgi:hypothetical protein
LSILLSDFQLFDISNLIKVANTSLIFFKFLIYQQLAGEHAGRHVPSWTTFVRTFASRWETLKHFPQCCGVSSNISVQLSDGKLHLCGFALHRAGNASSPGEKSYDLDWMRSLHKGLIGYWHLGVRKKELPDFHIGTLREIR